LELVILPGMGGRLWDVIFQGRSLLYQNPDLLGLPLDEIDLAELPTRSPQFGFPLWGGEKTWISPDTAWADGAPFSALDSDPFRVTSQDKAHIELTSQICPISHLSVTRRITLKSADAWSIQHSVTNHGHASRATGIWSVMMINTPAKIGVAMNDPEIHPVFGDAGSLVEQAANCVIADCGKQQDFKVGLPNPNGEALIKISKSGPWMLCSTRPPSPDDSFTHQYPFEIFNSGDYPYCEAEWHSPKSNLARAETLRFRQDFEIWPNSNPPILGSNRELLSCMS
jgi:hypothetical protein